MFNLITANGAINYTSNQLNKVVSGEQISIFYYDPSDKYPYQGHIITVDAYNRAIA